MFPDSGRVEVLVRTATAKGSSPGSRSEYCAAGTAIVSLLYGVAILTFVEIGWGARFLIGVVVLPCNCVVSCGLYTARL